MGKVYYFYVPIGEKKELCYNVGVTSKLTKADVAKLEIFFKEKPTDKIYRTSQLTGTVVEIGPKPSRETSFSSHAVDQLNACGLIQVVRVEVSRRTVTNNPEKFIKDKENCDIMTECVYEKSLGSFKVQPPVDQVIIVPTVGEIELIKAANKKFRMGMDEADEMHFWRLFNQKLRRDAKEAELHFIREIISDHSRHRTFGATIYIDGKKMPLPLMESVKLPFKLYPGNNVVAFHDNASAIMGDTAFLLTPEKPGWPSRFVVKEVKLHPTLTVETHCYPTQISPFPGAETGAGGDLRDGLAIGRGGNHLYLIAGFSMGNLCIPGYILPWEKMTPIFDSKNFASPLQIGIEAPTGAWDYGNKYGVPTLQGYYRTFGMIMPNGEHYAYWKPIMMAGLAGTIRDEHVVKGEAKKGMLICQIGGPAYDVGEGGGSGSSSGTDEKNSAIDYTAVQRANAGMGHLTWRVIRTFVEMGVENPLVTIHDQGAAGIENVLTELIEKSGGVIDVRKVKVGDASMTVIKLLNCEYQERYGFLIRAENLDIVQHVCAREGCPLEILGDVTGDGQVVFYDGHTGDTYIDLPLKEVLKGLPQREIRDKNPDYLGAPIELPKDISLGEALARVLRLPAVACKNFLVNHVDTSIMGLRVVGQACGPLFLPLSDFSMSSVDYEGSFGVATSIGEQPMKMMLNPRAGARMTAAEMFLNLSSVKFTKVEDIKPSINWMWPAKGMPGGVAKLYYAMESLTEFLLEFYTGGNGGKDSSSLYTKVAGKIVKSPETLVLTGEVRVDDIGKYVTPDIKKPGKSKLLLIDPSHGNCRLGGSSFLQVYGQLGDECPDINAKDLLNSILAEQEMIDQGLILSSHDRTGDGGLIVCILEMLFAGDCGATIHLQGEDMYATLFAEEAGKVIEYEEEKWSKILEILNKFNVAYRIIGKTTDDKTFSLYYSQFYDQTKNPIYFNSIIKLRQAWKETGYQIEKLQMNPKCAVAEFENLRYPEHPPYHLTFRPEKTPAKIMRRKNKPKVAVLRGKVTTGDREMAEALREAGHESTEVHLSDFKNGLVTLDKFQGLVIAPGFSHEDVFGAGKGFAMQILYDPRLSKQFTYFRARTDTWFMGCCNGCQVGAWLGMAPLNKLNYKRQPLFLKNESGVFESRPVVLGIQSSPSILFKGMEGSRFGSWVAHGEGRVWLPDESMEWWILEHDLVPLVYVDDYGEATDKYPFNPNGSTRGWAGLCDKSGRFTIMMPHPLDRSFKSWQWPWVPEKFRDLEVFPWQRAFQNAREWCDKQK
jgi:phosphoribosylformylglycinamidine synthase